MQNPLWSLTASNLAAAIRSGAVSAEAVLPAGAVIIAKSNTPEFAFGGQTENRVFELTRNPLDLSKTVAGSSGGAAAALAAKMVPLADGSDLDGSARSPAAWCGLFGLRPVRGFVLSAPSLRPFDGMHTPGPMARSCADLALFLEAISGPDPADPRSQGLARQSFSAGLQGDVAGLRVAWCMTPGGVEIETALFEALTPARTLLSDLGCEVRSASPEIGEMSRIQAVLRAWMAYVECGSLEAHAELL